MEAAAPLARCKRRCRVDTSWLLPARLSPADEDEVDPQPVKPRQHAKPVAMTPVITLAPGARRTMLLRLALNGGSRIRLMAYFRRRIPFWCSDSAQSASLPQEPASLPLGSDTT